MRRLLVLSILSLALALHFTCEAQTTQPESASQVEVTYSFGTTGFGNSAGFWTGAFRPVKAIVVDQMDISLNLQPVDCTTLPGMVLTVAGTPTSMSYVLPGTSKWQYTVNTGAPITIPAGSLIQIKSIPGSGCTRNASAWVDIQYHML